MLSVIVITKNEQANIGQSLESVKWADEIIVLDSGSTDNTVSIAKTYTTQVYTNTEWLGYGVQKQRALAYASQPWVLNIDADEIVGQDLKLAILDAIKNDEADAFRIPICMSFNNNPLRYCSSPKRHIRLFKRANSHYSTDIVHEKIMLPSNFRVKKIIHPLLHNSFADLHHALYKLNKYSSYSAQIRLSEKKTISFSRVLINTSWMFFRCYILQKGFLDGKMGFIMAAYNAQGAFYRGLKQIYPNNQTLYTNTNNEN